jgi:hypothetical protein
MSGIFCNIGDRPVNFMAGLQTVLWYCSCHTGLPSSTETHTLQGTGMDWQALMCQTRPSKHQSSHPRLYMLKRHHGAQLSCNTTAGFALVVWSHWHWVTLTRWLDSRGWYTDSTHFCSSKHSKISLKYTDKLVQPLLADEFEAVTAQLSQQGLDDLYCQIQP